MSPRNESFKEEIFRETKNLYIPLGGQHRTHGNDCFKPYLTLDLSDVVGPSASVHGPAVLGTGFPGWTGHPAPGCM